MDTFTLLPEHYNVLKGSIDQDSGWPSGSPRSWYAWVRANSKIDLAFRDLPDSADRVVLRDMVNGPADTGSCCVSILAWGGMNRKHGRDLMSCGEDWLSLSDAIRDGKYNRSDAYESFAKLRASNKLKGMGPAYFTKLIFFLMPSSKPTGYIMDQWTSASVNLLNGEKLVEMNRSYFQLKHSRRVFETVSDKNTSMNYDSYCNYVEFLSTRLSADTRASIAPDRVEEMLFSKGRGHGIWRNHLIKHR